METSRRPLKKKEVEELRGLVAPSTTIFRAFLFVLAGVAAGWLFHLLQRLLGVDGWWWLIPTIGGMAVLFRRAKRWTGGADLRRRVQRDLAEDEARVTRAAAVSAIGFAEHEDEGPAWVIECASGETLLFAGQYLDRLERRGFPWRQLAIVEAPHSGRFLGLEQLGEPLEAVQRRRPLTFEQARDLGSFERSWLLLDARGRAILGL